MIDFNINEHVLVQLTDAGRKEHKRQHEELKEQVPLLGEYTPPKEDEGGWSKWQCWSLMNTFGHMIYLGNNLNQPFNSNLKLNIKGENNV